MAPGSPLQRISGWICGRAAPREGWSSLFGGFQAQLDVARASVARGGQYPCLEPLPTSTLSLLRG